MKPALAWLLSVLFLAMGLFAQKPIVEGRADSPVRVVIYEDLQCPDCAVFRRMMDEKLLPRGWVNYKMAKWKKKGSRGPNSAVNGKKRRFSPICRIKPDSGRPCQGAVPANECSG